MGDLTRVADVIEALVPLARTATGLQVLDGPHVGEPMDEVLVIGLSESADRPGYQVRLTRQEGTGRPRYQELVEIRCLLSLTSGTSDVAPLRRRAADVLGLLDTALRDRVSSPGAWDRALLSGDHDWVPILSETGALVVVMFSITCVSLV